MSEPGKPEIAEVIRQFADCELPVEFLDHDPRRPVLWRPQRRHVLVMLWHTSQQVCRSNSI